MLTVTPNLVIATCGIYLLEGQGSLKFARDQKVEHLNRYLKDSLRCLGVNLNEKNAQRINKSADLGVSMESKVSKFFELDLMGKSHTRKRRDDQRRKLSEIFQKEMISSRFPGRKFRGPTVPDRMCSLFDEAKYRAWHLGKDKEFAQISDIRQKYFS